MAFAFILQSADGSYSIGSTRSKLTSRICRESDQRDPASTESLQPRRLVWAQRFQFMIDAVAMEYRVKCWSRAKRAALVSRDFVTVDDGSQRIGSFAQYGSAPHRDEDRF
jgi:putative endonuclease